MQSWDNTPHELQDSVFGRLPKNWVVKTLLDVTGNDKSAIIAGPFGSNLKVSDYQDTGIPIIRLQNIERNQFIIKDMKFISPSKAEELAYHSFKCGDIVLAKLGDPVGKTCLVPEQFEYGIVVSDVVRIRVNEKQINKHFLKLLLNSDIVVRQLTNDVIGTTRPRVNLDQVRNILLPLPPKSDQDAIAKIFNSLNQAIEQTEAIIAKQQRIKTGLMQDLLTKGIDEHGNIRSEATHEFKDSPLGRIPMEWEVPKLGTLTHLITSGSRGWAKYYSDEGAIFIRIGNLTREHINLRLDDIVYVNPPYSSEGKRTSVSEGDLLVSITADLGIVGIVPPNMGEAYVNQHIALVKLDENLINPRWVGHYLCSKTAQKQFKTLNETGAKAGLNLPTVASLNVLKPNRLEQDKIVSILDLKDLAISESKKELLKYTQLKTGLMQDLLTGNVRVTHLLDT